MTYSRYRAMTLQAQLKANNTQYELDHLSKCKVEYMMETRHNTGKSCDPRYSTYHTKVHIIVSQQGPHRLVKLRFHVIKN